MKNNQAWTREFSQCLVQLPTLIRQSDVQEFHLKRLRLLVFSYIHTRTHDYSEIVRFTNPDLLSFVANHKVETGDLALQFFLSTQWLTITELFVQDDFNFLIILVKDDSATSSRKGYLCVLVQHACMNYPSKAEKSSGMSTAALSIINSELCTNSDILSEFLGTVTLGCMSHILFRCGYLEQQLHKLSPTWNRIFSLLTITTIMECVPWLWPYMKLSFKTQYRRHFPCRRKTSFYSYKMKWKLKPI